MKPQTALKLRFSLWDDYTREEIETLRDEWITAYREIENDDPSKKELCESLASRIRLAAELFIGGEQESADSLDGDFTLGNETDMKLASSFFSIKELALLQTGLVEQIEPELVFFGFGHGNEKVVKNSARKGILADLRGSTEDAVEHYTTHCNHSKYPDDYVRMRLEAIKDKSSLESVSKFLAELAAEYKEKETSIRFLRYEFRSYGFIHRVAKTEEEKAVVRKCAEQILDCYQRELERTYRRIETYKKRGITDFVAVDSWTLTLDENGNFVRASIEGIDEKGTPIYGGNITEVDMTAKKLIIKNRRAELKPKLKELALSSAEEKIWFADDPDLYELQAAAQSLKQRGPLYGNGNPIFRSDLSGLTGGQLDAAAWQNYAIANGMVPSHVNYDDTLDGLLDRLQEFIELYEKALSIV